MNHQAAIIRAARQKGKDPTELRSGEYMALSIGVRSAREVASAAVKLASARVASAAAAFVRSLVVLPEVRDANLAVCRSNVCGSYGLLKDGAEVCHRCGCVGRNLHSKAEQRREHCPDNRWDNRSQA